MVCYADPLAAATLARVCLTGSPDYSCLRRTALYEKEWTLARSLNSKQESNDLVVTELPPGLESVSKCLLLCLAGCAQVSTLDLSAL